MRDTGDALPLLGGGCGHQRPGPDEQHIAQLFPAHSLEHHRAQHRPGTAASGTARMDVLLLAVIQHQAAVVVYGRDLDSIPAQDFLHETASDQAQIPRQDQIVVGGLRLRVRQEIEQRLRRRRRNGYYRTINRKTAYEAAFQYLQNLEEWRLKAAFSGKTYDRMVKMAKIISIVNQKGGVGKTTLTKCMACGLVELGYKVLAVDLDPQGNLSMGLNINIPDEFDGIATSLFERIHNREWDLRIVPVRESLDLLIGNDDLEAIDATLPGFTDGLFFLGELLDSVKDKYDYILIDCRPSMGALTKSAVIASDQIIIPTHPKYYSVKGIHSLMSALSNLKKRYNPKLEIAGVLPCQVDLRTNVARKFMAILPQLFEGYTIFDYIPVSTKIAETDEGLNPFDYDPNGAGVLAYRKFIQEYLEQEGGKSYGEPA